MGHGVVADTQVLAGRAHRHARHVLTGMIAMFVNQVGMAGGQIEESRQQCDSGTQKADGSLILAMPWETFRTPVRCVLITESELFSCL